MLRISRRAIDTWLVHRLGLETLAVAVRVLVFVAVIFVPVSNEVGGRVSPLVIQSSVDMDFYLLSAQRLFDQEINIIDDLVNIYDTKEFSPVFAPPLLPILLKISGYESGYTIPLSIVFLAIGIMYLLIWIKYFKIKNLNRAWIILFLLLPNSIWFTINISTDMLFAFIFSAFYFSYFQKTKTLNTIGIWAILLIAASLTRTISLSILAFIVVDQILFANSSRMRKFWIITVICLTGSVLLVLYFPSLGGYSHTSSRISFFGTPAPAFMHGIYPNLPTWMDQVASLVTLIGAKILYLVGLRPSFSEIPWYMLLLRSAQGLILLPGLVYLLLRGDRRELLLVVLYIIPVLLGPAQDRYVLPIQPILFYYGALAYTSLWRRARKAVPA